MNKILSNIKYKMSYQFSWVVTALSIYAVTMFLIFLPLIKFSVINQSEGSLVYRLGSVLVIFLFAISMRFKEDFDFLLTLSNTRDDIFLSQLGFAFAFSVLFSSLIVLEKLIVDQLNNVFEFHHIIDPFHFFSAYSSDSLVMQFVFFLVLCACSAIFGLLIGSLFYRFGKKFMLAFWLVFSAILLVVFPLILWILYLRNNLSQSITTMVDFLKYFDLPAASLILFILMIIFSLAAWSNIRRLPQK